MFKSILVPVDEWSHTLKAAEVAGSLAEKFDADLTLLHVKPRTVTGSILTTPNDTSSDDRISVDQPDAPDPAVDDIFERARNHANGAKRVQTTSRIGDPLAEIVSFVRSNGIDLVVVGRPADSGVLAKDDLNKLVQLVGCACLTVG